MQQHNPSTSSSGSHIFIDVRGNPLRVFIETSSVQARAKVVRMLRAGGAVITDNPKDSQITLVDSATEVGVALAAIWLDKPVLDAAWVYQANNWGAYIGADEDWGGYRVLGSYADDEEMPLPATSAKRGGAQNPGRSSDTQAEHSQDPSHAASSWHIQGRSDEVSSSNIIT
ncbi:hypothetical protein PHLCEN_2v1959 [Hermanssonia centrifuga]|uniref:BRCT domain-containing protein n=1 Tax=Hermanssonia centrifuga TaxID=98765 RepID=A0A2R6RVG8_9APHY|nr:hypothetical protein PHLCEN_2v1959 [Hermanssonia centrifuga]